MIAVLPRVIAAGLLVACGALSAASLPEEEKLSYSVNWPSGLSLGEVQISSKLVRGDEGPGRWDFSFQMDASIPGFAVRDHYLASATEALCSRQLEKNVVHGSKKSRERTVFKSNEKIATRQTLPDGGKSDIPIGACARDALTFLFFVRQELMNGRIPPQQQVLFGAPYDLKIDYSGAQMLMVGDDPKECDRFTAHIRGKASEHRVEMFFARDAARTPVLMRVPFALGTFALELVP
jgi:hypothetical protein